MVRGGPCRRRSPGTALVSAGATAYSASAAAWQRGPARIYDRLAAVLVERAPVPLRGGRVLDAGAGTGAAGRAALAAGASQVIAVDLAFGMLAHASKGRPPAALADVRALPFPAGCFDGAVAAFSLNHLADPAAGLREMVRVTRPGGCLLASAVGAGDGHPVKAAAEAALVSRGWVAEQWYAGIRDEIAPRLASADGLADAARAAGVDAAVHVVRVPFADLGAAELVEWRFGMAQYAPFVAGLDPADRAAAVADATGRLGPDHPPLVRSMVVIEAVSP